MRTINRSALLAALAVLALGALMSSSALAASTNNPLWKVGGALLAGGHTSELVNKSTIGTWELATAGRYIECSHVKVAAGATINGSAAPAAGTTSEKLVLETCNVVGAATCAVPNVTTKALTGTLGFLTKAAGEAETAPNVLVLAPVTGGVGSFMVVKITGETCAYKGEYFYEGQVALETPEGSSELKAHTFKAPTTTIAEYWVNSAGATVRKTARLFDGAVGSLHGQMNLELASGALWSISG